MSGFDRALGALGREEMLECARGLLRVLAGDAGDSSGASGGSGLAHGVRRAGGRGVSAGGEAGAFWPVARGRAQAGRVGRGADGARADIRGGRELERLPGAGSERGYGAQAEGPERRGREGGPSVGLRERALERDGAQAVGAGAAAFSGPERRYENSAGARGMEMSRVSDFFRRDSRRYDAGYTRF